MQDTLLGISSIDVALEEHLDRLGNVFTTFRSSDSGCMCYGVEWQGWRYFVKHAADEACAAGLERSRVLHHQVQHSSLPRLLNHFDTPQGRALVYEWVDGRNVYENKDRFYGLPVTERLRCLTVVYDIHRTIADAGFIAVDFYDGCILYDFDRRIPYVCDLDEYRAGAFRVAGNRLPGSKRFMAPEEFEDGALIDQVSNVYMLGRTAMVMLGDGSGDEGSWGWTEASLAIARRATQPQRSLRYQRVTDYLDVWLQTAESG